LRAFFPVNDQQLMQSIKTEYGALLAEEASHTAIPESFLAALIANESGGNAQAKRFEGNVLASLWEVLLGRKAAYGSVRASDLVAYVKGTSSRVNGITGALFDLDDLAHSWGLTQVMGYHVLDPGLVPVPVTYAASLANPEIGMGYTVALLEQFARTWRLDERLNFAELLRCWNTGRPDGKTFDPSYVSNGLHRMALYQDLA